MVPARCVVEARCSLVQSGAIFVSFLFYSLKQAFLSFPLSFDCCLFPVQVSLLL